MNRKNNTSWTIEEELRLLELLETGASHSYIAEELGRSKNAITNRVFIIRSSKGLVPTTPYAPEQQEFDFGELSSPHSPMTAPDILLAAAAHLEERANTYDASSGERSIASTVRMFNTLTGFDLSEEQGWLFMVCLKLARAQQGAFRADSYEDGAAYFALAGEAASNEWSKNNEN